MTDHPALRGSDAPLTAVYDAALFDLDGVLYLMDQPIPRAPEGVAAARAAGMRIGFVTNNASRRSTEVAALLTAVGVAAEPEEVVTSAQASAALLAEMMPSGVAVLVVGAPALSAEVADVGLRPVLAADEKPHAVVQGYSPDVGWRILAEASVAIRSGARWVATNADTTLPSARGPLPGNGSLVAALATALGHGPDEIVGKPHPRLHEESVRRTGARVPLVVGDRLDTDIAGAVAGRADSLLVLTGVATPSDVLAAAPHARPTYVAADLDGLAEPHPAVRTVDGITRCREWTAGWRDGAVVLAGDGTPIDALRALAVCAWAGPGGAPPRIVAESEPAGEAVAAWGFSSR